MLAKVKPAQLKPARDWFASRGWKPFPFQKEAWQAVLEGKQGLLNAPTGSGKTYALFLAGVLEFIRDNPDWQEDKKRGLQFIWLTPIRALAEEIRLATERALEGMGVPWRVGVRNGDTSTSERQKQTRNMPEVLITTPESLHLLLAQKEYPKRFKNLKLFVADEWHELMGSKRGVQVELALSRLRTLAPEMRTWAISATIGNLEQAMEVILGATCEKEKAMVIRSGIKKKIKVRSVLPDDPEKFPWSGHLGIKLLAKVVPIIQNSRTTLIFTNTRAQAEIWYQRILDIAPDLAGAIAMHHGSISKELRNWVEGALHEEKLKAVVCTSSLDLGVDFRPVETIVQIGGPKGVARFMQRAGRSGHQPGATSEIWFVPTHSLELIEAAALRQAIEEDRLESRPPVIRSFDVLAQYLLTLAVSDGFKPSEIYREIIQTYAYQSVSPEEFDWVLDFISTGGNALYAYDEYKKLEKEGELYRITNRRTAMMHRLSIGTIVGSEALMVKFLKGGKLGTIEEWFIAQLKPGDVFWFAGRNLELVKIKDMQVLVRKTREKSGKVPSWQGGRMPLSAQLGSTLREKMGEAIDGHSKDPEIKAIAPIIDFQRERSAVPRHDELLIEQFRTREGHHLVVYPFEGRFVHEAMASLLGYRMGLIRPLSFSIAVSDYGFELLSDQEIPFEEALDNNCFTTDFLNEDLQAAINSGEMARRQFRDIAAITGLVFQGYPGQPIKTKHLQASSQLFFDVFREYDPENLLFRQAFEEVFIHQLEEDRLRLALERIANQKLLLTYPEKPTPFAFPMMVDRLRQRMSNEKLEDRVRRMQVQFAK